MESARAAFGALRQYMAELIERYLKEPGEGLLSHVVNDDGRDGPMLGGPLARLEVNLAPETFIRRVQNPRPVVDPPPYRRSHIFRPAALATRLRTHQRLEVP